MPVTTPFVKVEATQAHGAEVVLDGESVAEAQVRARDPGAASAASPSCTPTTIRW